MKEAFTREAVRGNGNNEKASRMVLWREDEGGGGNTTTPAARLLLGLQLLSSYHGFLLDTELL